MRKRQFMFTYVMLTINNILDHATVLAKLRFTIIH